MWQMYQPLLRSDFRLFDEYRATTRYGSAAPFSCPLRLFWGAQDRRVGEAMVQGWRAYTTAACSASCIDGNHLWPLQPAAKQAWLAQVAAALEAAMG